MCYICHSCGAKPEYLNTKYNSFPATPLTPSIPAISDTLAFLHMKPAQRQKFVHPQHYGTKCTFSGHANKLVHEIIGYPSSTRSRTDNHVV
ncbi:hypothetical protein RSOLAG1IB_00251 [Rhizoctonia solani AG-1 IB]|uniref:Uncharacterized protein n=1 Tax=Thanatephorus cucumeris (strain AG1-IB / isolate 7/3/14) TaxID=1108050 RepID=A0A0B7F0Z0_THACB|nr:hypothetical protein RSOLAG1IB_00251 [Rhizoctonia solani AG-1 IB]